MKITKINITRIGGIESLALNFNGRFNILCGPNGIGKTTVLECIGHAFALDKTRVLKRKAGSEPGNFFAVISADNQVHNVSVSVDHFDPTAGGNASALFRYARNFLSLKAVRNLEYQNIDAVRKDAVKHEVHLAGEAQGGIKSEDVKNWFINRYLYSAHSGSLTEEQLYNLNLAKEAFSVLNPEFGFSHVAAASNEIMVNTPSGTIYYEYLSSGFKSCLTVIFSIIKEIELRFKEPTIRADAFDGIIVIDELELHLHPEWQGKIAEILVRVFPGAQFIVSTHSPHIIQSALPEQIIALGADDTGNVYQRTLPSSNFGFQGWTVEEVLVDVMGMADTRTLPYHKAIENFESAISEENLEAAEVALQTLNEMLHPRNHLRKLLRLELASIQEK